MPVRIKICGITSLEDARVAVNLGVNALGFIFVPSSKRCISAQVAREISLRIPAFVSKVGVFVDEDIDTINQLSDYCLLDTVQMHGSESPEMCAACKRSTIKAFQVRSDFNLSVLAQYPTQGLLLDTWDPAAHGGTGKSFDWSIARKAVREYSNIILAGGLGPANLAEALEQVEPFAVDLNSGVEIRPGKKNPLKIREAVDIIRRHPWQV